MGLLAKLIIAILVICFLILVAFFGRLPALRNTPIAWLHRLIWVKIPGAVLAIDNRLTGGRLTSSVGRFFTFMLHDKHPTILVFFLLLLTVGEVLYLPGAWPRLSTLNQVLGAISIVLPYWFLYKAAYTDPGIITPANHARHMSHYPYDFTLYHPGAVCRTCLLLKPARSKHCSVCKRCVGRMDHHCVFINNCVGYGNQHFFLLLLLTTAWLTTYGAALGWTLVRDSAVARTSNDAFRLWKPSRMPWEHYFLLLMVGIQDDVGVGSVTLLATMTNPMVWALLGYHVYLIWAGTTTNESMKWSDWKIEMDEGCAFKRALNPENPSQQQRSRDFTLEPAWTRWPVEPLQILVRTDDGHPPHRDSPYGYGEWERVWSLRDVENLYDIGFWDNLTDIMVKDYSFRAEGKGRPPRDDDDAGVFGDEEADVEGYGHRDSRGGGGSSSSGGNGNDKDLRRAHKERARRSKKPNMPTVAGIVNAAT